MIKIVKKIPSFIIKDPFKHRNIQVINQKNNNLLCLTKKINKRFNLKLSQ